MMTALSIILPIVALLGAFGASIWLGRSQDRIGDASVAYVRAEANVRECPRLACRVSETYPAGQQLLINATVRGDRVEETDEWYETRYGPGTRFVHRDVAEAPATSVARTVEGLFSLLALCVIIPLALSLRRMQESAAQVSDHAALDGLLFGAVAATGIATGTLGFVFSRVSGESATSFFAGTFVNLGAGLAGAAVAFVLFQSLLARRSVSAGELAALADNIDRLRADLLSQVGGIREEIGRHPALSTPHGQVEREFALSGIVSRLRRLLGRPQR
jgi:hypothetical protein